MISADELARFSLAEAKHYALERLRQRASSCSEQATSPRNGHESKAYFARLEEAYLEAIDMIESGSLRAFFVPNPSPGP